MASEHFEEPVERMPDLPYAGKLLGNMRDLYLERNAVYKDNFRRVGAVMEGLFPNGPPILQTKEDYNRWHLFELAIVKLTRYAVQYNEGGHKDSIEDMIVYLAMVASLDKELDDKLKLATKA